MIKFKKAFPVLCAAMVSLMLSCGVSAEEVSTEETAAATSEESTVDDAAGEVPAEPEIIHIAAGEELPDYFYVVPKEQIEAKADDSTEALYAYIAIEVKKNYLDKENVSSDEFYKKYNEADIETMKAYYKAAIIDSDEFSYYLDKTFSAYTPSAFTEGDEIAGCVMRGIFVYCDSIGLEPEDYLDPGISICGAFDLTADSISEKITFSEDQLHYFEN